MHALHQMPGSARVDPAGAGRAAAQVDPGDGPRGAEDDRDPGRVAAGVADLDPFDRGEPLSAPLSFGGNGYLRTVLALSGCTGRLLAKPRASVSRAICALEAVTWSFITSQITPSEQGGVVSDPLKR